MQKADIVVWCHKRTFQSFLAFDCLFDQLPHHQNLILARTTISETWRYFPRILSTGSLSLLNRHLMKIFRPRFKSVIPLRLTRIVKSSFFISCTITSFSHSSGTFFSTLILLSSILNDIPLHRYEIETPLLESYQTRWLVILHLSPVLFLLSLVPSHLHPMAHRHQS